MAFRKPSADALRSAAAALLLALAAVLALHRAAGLAAAPNALSAAQERRFFTWAWRAPGVAAAFAAVAPALAPGEPVMLVVAPAKGYSAGWWRTMAAYHLPANPILGVRVGPPGSLPAGDWTVLAVSAADEVRIVRHARHPRPAL
jgi:hypothetical protein